MEKKQKENTQQTQARKKSYILLIVGVVLLAASIAFTVYAKNTSYAASLETKTQISELKAEIEAVEAGTAAGNLEELQAQQTQLSDLQLSQERPYSYGLTALFFAILLVGKGLFNALVGTAAETLDVKKLAQAGLLAALCYIGFAFFKIDIPVGPEKTAFHFGNVFCVLAALLLGGFWGGLAGAVGMTIGDLTTAYVTSAPKTFLLKLCIGLIVGLVAHGIFKLSRTHSKKYVTGVTILASVCGMGFNIVADPLVGYFYKMYLLGVPQELSAALAKVATLTTTVNAVVAVIAASIFYLALRPALRKAGLFVQVTPEQKDMQ
ncbi:MAG: ECF transporter S component [Lachnospiraceae bacterium]|nr:ECF transporter S component [Lachnospiraceae bacterium]